MRSGFPESPIASDVVRAGATLVLMSGDKLLGGPQAGIIVGKSAAVSRLKINPLARALRVDKLTLAALSATLQLYREPERAMSEIPILVMLAQDSSALAERANAVRSAIGSRGIECAVVKSVSTVGAGAFPGAELESFSLSFRGNAAEFESRMRAARIPVIGRIQDGDFLLDMRSVIPEEDALLADLIAAAMQ